MLRTRLLELVSSTLESRLTLRSIAINIKEISILSLEAT